MFVSTVVGKTTLRRFSAARVPGRDRVAHHGVHAVALLGVDERPECDLSALGIADRQVVGVLDEDGAVFIGDARVDQVTSGRHADLTLVGERNQGANNGGLFEVRVVKMIIAEFPLAPSARA